MKLQVSFLLILLAVLGCGSSEQISGKYYGRMAIKEMGGFSSHRIQADVQGSFTKFAVTLQDRDSKTKLGDVAVEVDLYHKRLIARSPLFQLQNGIRLTAAGACGNSSNTATYEAEICTVGNAITITYRKGNRSLSLQVYRTKPGDDTELLSKSYTITELTEIAKKQNLDVLLKAQDLYRAREEVLLRRGNLFPNFNLGTILSAIESPFGLLSQIGNLMPFLFPDNWYRLAATKELKLAQENSYKSLKANQIHIVVGVALLTLRDRALKSTIQSHMADLQDVLERVQLLIQNGQAPSSWEQIVRMKLLDDEEDVVNYEQFLAQQMVGIQKLLGAQPNAGGISIEPEVLPSIGPNLIQDLTEEEMQAFQLSPELKGTLHLEKAAAQMAKAVTWSWLNPNTDPRFNLGLGLEHAIKIEKSHIEDIKIKRKAVDHTIRGNTLEIGNGVKFLVDQYALAQKGEDAAREGLKVALKQFENGEISVLDTLEFTEQLFKYRAKKLVAQFTYLVVQDKLNRHTLSGFYQKLPLPPEPKEREATAESDGSL